MKCHKWHSNLREILVIQFISHSIDFAFSLLLHRNAVGNHFMGGRIKAKTFSKFPTVFVLGGFEPSMAQATAPLIFHAFKNGDEILKNN